VSRKTRLASTVLAGGDTSKQDAIKRQIKAKQTEIKNAGADPELQMKLRDDLRYLKDCLLELQTGYPLD
jgi:hypothetical protein